MAVVPDADNAYQQLRQNHHRHCVVCGQAMENGFGLEFRCIGGEKVEAEFACRRSLEGYPRVLHGGVICAVLDGAMTNCLFATGTLAVTGDLRVRFRKPVIALGTATVSAWIEERLPPLYRVSAQLEQNGEVKATARARFMELPQGQHTSGLEHSNYRVWDAMRGVASEGG